MMRNRKKSWFFFSSFYIPHNSAIKIHSMVSKFQINTIWRFWDVWSYCNLHTGLYNTQQKSSHHKCSSDDWRTLLICTLTSMASYLSTLLSFSRSLTKSFLGGWGTNDKHDCKESSSDPNPLYGGITCNNKQMIQIHYTGESSTRGEWLNYMKMYFGYNISGKLFTFIQ